MPQAINIIKRSVRAVFALVILLPVIVFLIRTIEDGWKTIAIAVIPLALALRFGSPLFRRVENLLARVARRRAIAVLLVAFFAFAVSVSLSISKGVRDPDVTDEFSYLLAADTFANGRLTNPPHPMWMYFETIHVIQQPTYASKYPPGQGLALAAGIIIAGHPIVGVWLSLAMAAAALCWMLMAWMPARWAFAGGLMIVFHPMFLQWSQSYWGGALAVCGGAIAAGAFRCMMKKQRARDAILMGAGMAILALSRPFEGLILSMCLGIALLTWMLKRNSMLASLRQVVLPLGVMVALTLCWTGFYNWRVTGNPLRMAYSVHEEAYGIAPLFVFQKLRPEPHYNHEAIRNLHTGWELSNYLDQQSLVGFLNGLLSKLGSLLEWNFRSLAFLVPLLMLPAALSRDRWTRFAFIVIFVCVAAIALETWLLPHYFSPLVGLFYLIALQAMRRLRAISWRGQRVGRAITRATLILAIALLLASWVNWPAVDRSGWNSERARMIEEMKRGGERHLIMVRYGPRHLLHQEWVHNEADIDRATVIWARGTKDDGPLMEYFKDRRVWLLSVDDGRAVLSPYQ
jgi:hypothetical protein